MRTFLEYSYNLEQVSNIFKKMYGDKDAKSDDQLKFIIGMIPPDFIEKLPDGARGDAALVFRRILAHDMDSWDKLGKYVQQLWDQPIAGPGKTLGRDLLNRMSAVVMHNTGSDFFISYSGDMSKSTAHSYTNTHPRVFVSKSNYRWGPYHQAMKTISGDYAEHFNNYRQKQMK